jgi:hypothetical protein
MDKLTIVNRLLGSIGERPINSITSNHRLLGACLSIIDETNRRLQAPGWWFNIEAVTLYPNSVDGRVYVPNDCLDIRTVRQGLVHRGRVLYDVTAATDVITAPVVCAQLTRLIQIEEVPELFGSYVMYASAVLFQTQFDADGTRVSQLQAMEAAARALVRDEDTRQLDINLIRSHRALHGIVRGVESSWYINNSAGGY